MDGGSQVAAQKSALVHLVKHVDDDHVPVGQAVDGPLIGRARQALGPSHGVHGLLVVRAHRRVHGRHSAAHQFSVYRAVFLELRVQGLHGDELALVALDKNGLPKLFQRHAIQRVQIFVRHLGTAVLEALPRPFRGHGDDFFSCVKQHR